MKKLSLLYAVAFATLTMFMTSCSSEDVDPIGPKMSFVGTSSVNEYVNAGDSVVFEFITSKGDKNLDKITFRVNGNALNEARYTVNGEELTSSATYSIKNNEKNGATYTIVIYAASTAGTENIEIALSDKDGLTAGLSVSITTDLSALQTRSGAKVYHILGAEEGAYDLHNNNTVAESGAATSKDIVNQDVNGVAFTGKFTVGTGNGSQFVVANSSFSYENATKTSIANAFAAGSATTTVTPSTGDIILVKLRNLDQYAALKITEIEAEYGDSGNGNTGSMTFDYKSSYLAAK